MKQNSNRSFLISLLFIGFLISSYSTCSAARLLIPNSKTQINTNADSSNMNGIVHSDEVDFHNFMGPEDFDEKYEASSKGRGRMVTEAEELDAHVDYIYSQKHRNR